MPRSRTNLTANAQGASTSTTNARNSVKSKSRNTKAEILKLLYDERQKVLDGEKARKELLRTISAKDLEISIYRNNAEFWKGMHHSTSVCCDALIVTSKAMNSHCGYLQSEINKLKQS